MNVFSAPEAVCGVSHRLRDAKMLAMVRVRIGDMNLDAW